MSESFSFSGDRPLMSNIVVDGSMSNLVWSPQDTSVYTENVTLSDTMNEGYVTATEDNETQYLSVLDSTGEISLENLNLTLGNPKLEILTEDEQQNEELETNTETNLEEVDNQVVVFTMEGSNELFGIQLAQDEEGNIHKYQFQFRKNDLGQLEAIPETVQVLPMDEEESPLMEESVQEMEDNEEVHTSEMQIFVRQEEAEHILSDNLPDETIIHEESQFESEENDTILQQNPLESDEEDATIDIKPVVLDVVKQETHEHLNYSSVVEEEEDEEQEQEEEHEDQLHEEEPIIDVKMFQTELQPQEHFLNEDTVDSEQEAFDNCLEINEYQNQTEADEEHDQIPEEQQMQYIEENYVTQIAEEDETQQFLENQTITFTTEEEALQHHPELMEQEMETEDATTIASETFFQESAGNDSDNDDFHIVEGVHITGDVEEPSENHPEPEKPRTNIAVVKSNILRHALKASTNEVAIRKDNRLYLYLVHPEKENVHALSTVSQQNHLVRPVVRTNPRSILKTSVGLAQQQHQQQQLKIAAAVDHGMDSGRLLNNNKRFARGKEAMQAKLFNNFINKTTIPQAPIRTERLPRKQAIKPVTRMDEEIVVQEVMVSSDGFVETSAINKKGLEVTGYVDITDSDDEFDPKKKVSVKRKKRSKRGNKSRVEITISSDSESEEDDVVELDDDDDDDDSEDDDDDDDVEEESEHESSDEVQVKEVAPSNPVKRRRGRPPKNSKINESSESLESPLKKMCLSETEKVEIPCPKCPKTFPSENSLKTHLQHHNLQSTMSKRQDQQQQDKYKCSKCEEAFKNKVLLDRHTCTFICSICSRKFPNVITLNAHKRFHAKERLCKMSATVQVSPKKIKPRVVPPRASKIGENSFSNRCKMCGKTFSTQQLLAVHAKSHREVACATCSARFPSRILMEKHVRENCVKVKGALQAGGGQRRLTRSTSSSTSSLAPSPPKFARPTTPRTRSALKVSCDKCQMKFPTFKALLKHQALKHGLETPDKSFLDKNGSEKKRVHKEGKVHSGIQPTSKFQAAYRQLRQKLEFLPNKL